MQDEKFSRKVVIGQYHLEDLTGTYILPNAPIRLSCYSTESFFDCDGIQWERFRSAP